MIAIFDVCMAILVTLAKCLGMTYQAVNVWIFVILWPVLTFFLIGLIVRQHLLIKHLRRDRLIKESLDLSVYKK
jgi:hypothetical protein